MHGPGQSACDGEPHPTAFPPGAGGVRAEKPFEPAVEVVVPTAVTSERSTSFLVDLGAAVSRTEQVRECL